MVHVVSSIMPLLLLIIMTSYTVASRDKCDPPSRISDPIPINNNSFNAFFSAKISSQLCYIL